MVSFGYMFHDSKRTPITDAYTIKEARGTGKFSVVKEAVENATNKPVALKIMKKSVVQEHNLLKEVEILRHLNHLNIVSLYDIFETDLDLILVLELVTGGELFDKIVERVSYTEEDAAKLVQQIISVLHYLHNKNIVHCDLKPENLLYSDTSSDAIIKLCDFGLSQVLVNNIPLTAILGTPTYMAPEIRACVGYGKPVDMWSLGVIVYILLCGYPPFDETTCLLEFPSPEWDNISTSAKDLIINLLVVDTTKRLTVQQAMSHLWVSGATAGKQSIAGALKTMRVFNTARKSGTGTPFRGPTSRASVFNLFPDAEDKTHNTTTDDIEYPAADSPAFFTIHNPIAGLELEYSPSSQSPNIAYEAELARGGSPLEAPSSPEKREWGGRTPTNVVGTVAGVGKEGSNSQRWDGADSKEMLARELGLILQANPQFLRSLSEVSGPGSAKSSLSNSGQQQSINSTQSASLEDLMNSLTAGIDTNELVRPLSGHFSRVAHLEDQLKDLQSALDSERNNRITMEDALDTERNNRITVEHALDAERYARKSAEETHARIATQVTHAQDEARRFEAYASVHQDQELVDMGRNLVNYLDTIIVNINKGLKPAPPRSDSNDWSTMKDTIEGLKEENATLDKLYRQTKAELEVNQKVSSHDSLRKKNKQLAKELEMLHKEYETLLHSKGGSDEPSIDDADEFFEDRRGKRKNNKSGFLKRIIG